MTSRGRYGVNSDRAAIMWKEDFWLVPRVKTSLWLWLGVAMLLVSNLLYLVSFVTNGWGRITYQDFEVSNSTVFTLDFGLWIACRHPDPVCTGDLPGFYGAFRAFSVLSLFGHVFSISLLIGHAVEKLLDYDPCGMSLITSICFATSIFMLVSVSVFGALWPKEYIGVFDNATIQLRYSFIIACVIIILPTIAGIMCIIEIKQSLVRLAHHQVAIEELRPDYTDIAPSTSNT